MNKLNKENLSEQNIRRTSASWKGIGQPIQTSGIGP